MTYIRTNERGGIGITKIYKITVGETKKNTGIIYNVKCPNVRGKI